MSIDSIGIVGYGTYVPKGRVSVDAIARMHGRDANKIKRSLGVYQKSIPGDDEDTATIAVVAAQKALERAQIEGGDIGAIYVGSESHPYAVKPTATIVGQALNVDTNYMAADIEFACKAGTASLQLCYACVKAGLTEYALAIGADVAQSRPGDVLEYSASAGGAALIVGSSENEMIATIEATLSVTSDTPDFWRRALQPYPEHTGRFTGKPSYFAHVIEATEQMLKKVNMKPQDFDHVVFHQPNAKFPIAVAKKLGFTMEQIRAGLLVDRIGNTYSANSLLGLCAVLDVASPGQMILMTSYGSGAGSDAFVFKKGFIRENNSARRSSDKIWRVVG